MSREEEFTDEPPRRREDRYGEEPRRRNQEDEDDHDRPRRSRDDPDYLDVRKRNLSGMDGFFGNTNIALLVFLALCCNGVALILGIIGLATCKDEEARSKALIVTIIGGIITVLAVGFQIMAEVNN